MNLVVLPDRAEPTRGRVQCDGALYDCALGRAGVTAVKQEGDGATPAGSFLLRRVLFRADRIDPPVTHLPVTALTEINGWCDDPKDPNYNQPVEHPYKASAERLWRDDNRYDVIVVLGHNDDPVIPGAGSAIFLHVAAPDFRATEGCVAMRREDLLTSLKQCGVDSKIHIQAITP